MKKDILLKETINFLKVPSVTYNTDKALEFIINFCQRYNLEIVHEINGNLIIKKKDVGFSGTVFCGHYDTVSGNSDVNIKDDYIYGRGSCDMKSSIISMLLSCAESSTNSPAIFLVNDEETDSEGINLLKPYLTDFKWGVIGEPTGLKICDRHKGRAVYELTLYGESCHASYMPENNVFFSLKKIIDLFQKKSKNKNKDLTITPVNINIEEKSLNKVPQKIELIIDRRQLPPLSSWEKDIKNLKNEFVNHGLKNFKLELLKSKKNHTLPYKCENTDLLTKLQKILNKTGHPSSLNLFNATCDARFCGEFIPVVIFGPGQLKEAHTGGEKISIDELTKSCLLYGRINGL
ncbi:MAG: M20/M25/M40 family metallo-hydrolase [Candidatus Muiribacteriota bacterium]